MPSSVTGYQSEAGPFRLCELNKETHKKKTGPPLFHHCPTHPSAPRRAPVALQNTVILTAKFSQSSHVFHVMKILARLISLFPYRPA